MFMMRVGNRTDQSLKKEDGDYFKFEHHLSSQWCIPPGREEHLQRYIFHVQMRERKRAHARSGMNLKKNHL